MRLRFGALADNPASSGARFSLRARRSSYLRLRYEGERRVSRSRLAARGATPTLYILVARRLFGDEVMGQFIELRASEFFSRPSSREAKSRT